MRMPNIMQGFGLEIIMIAEIGYLWVQSLKNRNTSTLSAFHNLCSALMMFLIINIPVRLADLNLLSLDPRAVFILNAVYIELEVLTAYEMFIYFLTVQGSDFLHSKEKKRIIAAPVFLMMILLCVSYKTNWLFYVNESGMYTRGSLFVLQFLIPYSYIAASFISTFNGYRRNQNKRVLAILLSAFLSSIIASVLQVLYSGSFTHAGFCLVVFLVYIEMYQYEIKQTEKVRSLRVVNEQLEIVNDKLTKTVCELETSIANERAANDAKNDFLSRMSHDMRTPINGILGIIEIDERHPDDIDLLTENRHKAKTAANHLASLINDILDMSKLGAGKYEFHNEPFDISAVLDDVLMIANTNTNKNEVRLNAEKDMTEYPLTSGSPLHVKRILLSIIGNGIKYNKKGGSVSIELAHEYVGTDRVKYTFTISDTGIGMSEEYIGRLFEPFSQEHAGARTVYDGTGLGMAITKALVDKMGGTIDVKSEIGKGSAFIVALPFEIVQRVVTKSDPADKADDLSGLRILLAEDNELNIDIAKSLLEDYGASVDVAEDGRLALKSFSENPEGTYDVILMDCMMPNMDGYEAAKAIRKLERSDAKTIPIIAMTANAFADDIRRCLDSGMNYHLAKPYDIAKVITAIKKYVK